MKIRALLEGLALRSHHERYKHAAMVGTNKKVYGVGVNGTQHAEVAAITNAGECQGLSLYTLMTKPSGVGNGTPCSRCMKAIRAAKIKKVIVYI